MFYAQVYDDLQSALDIENDCDNGDLVSRDGAQVRANLNAQPMYRPPSSFTTKSIQLWAPFFSRFMVRLRRLKPGQRLLFGGGWSTPDGESSPAPICAPVDLFQE